MIQQEDLSKTICKGGKVKYKLYGCDTTSFKVDMTDIVLTPKQTLK